MSQKFSEAEAYGRLDALGIPTATITALRNGLVPDETRTTAMIDEFVKLSKRAPVDFVAETRACVEINEDCDLLAPVGTGATPNNGVGHWTFNYIQPDIIADPHPTEAGVWFDSENLVFYYQPATDVNGAEITMTPSQFKVLVETNTAFGVTASGVTPIQYDLSLESLAFASGVDKVKGDPGVIWTDGTKLYVNKGSFNQAVWAIAKDPL